MNRISILGATGSIGRQTLDVIALHPERFEVFALSANRSVDEMVKLCAHWKPKFAVMNDPASAESLAKKLSPLKINTTVLSGDENLCMIASHPDVDTVMAGIVGGAGLRSSMAAASSGKKILLANKESLVMAGNLFLSAAKQSGAMIVPVDSEHNAVFQCWKDTAHPQSESIARIYLTASGGPFLRFTPEQMEHITPEQAVRHPRWNMGAKISVDSATLVNKGLEMIEAHFLFNLPRDKLSVLIHPQSMIHAMVEYIDGTVLTHLGESDMRIAISHALGWPHRIQSGVTAKNLLGNPLSLHFESLQPHQFPCFVLAMQAMNAGQADVIIFNAANEVAVKAFLDKRIAFLDIHRMIEEALATQPRMSIHSLEDVLRLDAQCRMAVGASLLEFIPE